MPSTLILTGSLAPKRVHDLIVKYQKSKITVLEFDTTINKLRYPFVSNWLTMNELILPNDKLLISRAGDVFLEGFLNIDFRDKRVPLHRNFIGSCINFEIKALITSFLINIEVYKKIKGLGAFDQYVIIPGNGINIQAWQAIATLHNAPINFAKRESYAKPFGRGLKRFIKRLSLIYLKLFSLKRNKHKCISADILCVGNRIASILLNEDKCITSKYLLLSETEISKTDNRKIIFNQNIYSEIWGNFIRNNPLIEYGSELNYFDSVLFKEVGDIFFNKIFPNKSIIYSNAIKVIGKLRPQFVICTTQLGANERMWSLAAHELEICVVAYSYDGIIELKNAVFPDYLLCDSASIANESHEIAFSFDKTILVKSHRSLKKPNRGMRARKMKYRIVYADTFFCGYTPYDDPGCSYLADQILIQTALRCSDIEFHIKFHPIRGKKNQNLAWSGFDERELLIRKKYIRDLLPPSNVSFIDPEYKLSDILDDYDILINLNSFAAIEAFEIKIPVIFLFYKEQLIDDNGFNYFNENGSLLSANNSNELVEMLYSILQNNKLRGYQIQKQYDFISNYLYPESQNIISTIDSLSQNSPKIHL